jgi:GMP synthase (glutamine-hydrolysing)
VGHACEIAGTPGISVPQLRADTLRFSPALEASGVACFGDWFSSLGL